MAAGPFVAACSLLVIAGSRKVCTPAPPAKRSRPRAVPRPVVGVVRSRSAVELATGVAGVVFGGRAALAVAVLYLALGGFAWRLLRRAPTTPCACLGSSTASVSRAHVLINLGAGGAALAAASGGSPLARLAGRPQATIVFVVLVACCVQLLALALDALPALANVVKENRS